MGTAFPKSTLGSNRKIRTLTTFSIPYNISAFSLYGCLPKTVSDFNPDKYRRFLCYKGTYKPLGIYDPLGTIDALIKALSTLWTAENGLIHKFRMFKLRSFNILWGKSNPNENRWTTLIAYCGECGKNPLVLGESKICEHRSLICPEPDCGFCCDKCEKKNNAEALENE